MKRWTLIAALAILAAIGLVPTAANAHDGPAVTVAALDAALPQLAAVTTESGSYELALLSAFLALPADTMYSLTCDGGAERIERADYTNVSVIPKACDHAGNHANPEHRARDVQGDPARA